MTADAGDNRLGDPAVGFAEGALVALFHVLVNIKVLLWPVEALGSQGGSAVRWEEGGADGKIPSRWIGNLVPSP